MFQECFNQLKIIHTFEIVVIEKITFILAHISIILELFLLNIQIEHLSEFSLKICFTELLTLLNVVPRYK